VSDTPPRPAVPVSPRRLVGSRLLDTGGPPARVHWSDLRACPSDLRGRVRQVPIRHPQPASEHGAAP